MLKNLVKKFTSHSLNDGEDVDGSGLGGPMAAPNAAAHSGVEPVAPPSPICSTPAKTYPALRSSTANSNLQYAQLRRNPLSSGGGGQTAMATDFRCPKVARDLNVVSNTATCTRSQRRAKKQQANGGQQQQQQLQKRDKQRSNNNRSNVGDAAAVVDDCEDEELKDSGTESDEELAIIETNSIKSVPVSLTSDYYTSQQSLSASCRSSHCGSPSLDQESVSWDSFGCESNVSCFRANAVNSVNDANDIVLDVELPNHHYHTRQQFKRFLKHQQKQEAGGVTPPAVDGGCDKNSDPANVALSMAPALPSAGSTAAITTVELSPAVYGQDSKNVFGLNYESVVAGTYEHQTPVDDTLYDKQLASPANSCGSSIDELESINGSSTTASEPGGTRDKNFADSDFAVPELTSHIGNRHRSSLPNPQNSKFAVPGAVNFLQTRGNNTGNVSPSNNSIVPVASQNVTTTTTAEKRKWSQVQQSGDINKQQQQQNSFVANFGANGGAGDFATTTKTNHNYFSGGGGATAFRTSASSFRQPAIVATRNAKNQVIGNTGALCEEIQSGGDPHAPTPTFNDVWKHQDIVGDSSAAATNAMARRQPVRLVIPPPLTTSASGEEALPSPDDFAFQTPSNKVSPRKKYRSTTTTIETTVNAMPATTEDNDTASERQRPSLNFEKMREKLRNKGSRRKHQNVNTIVMKSKLRGWSGGYQLRSTHSECLFQPLRFPPSPPSLGAGVSGE